MVRMWAPPGGLGVRVGGRPRDAPLAWGGSRECSQPGSRPPAALGALGSPRVWLIPGLLTAVSGCGGSIPHPSGLGRREAPGSWQPALGPALRPRAGGALGERGAPLSPAQKPGDAEKADPVLQEEEPRAETMGESPHGPPTPTPSVSSGPPRPGPRGLAAVSVPSVQAAKKSRGQKPPQGSGRLRAGRPQGGLGAGWGPGFFLVQPGRGKAEPWRAGRVLVVGGHTVRSLGGRRAAPGQGWGPGVG